LADVRPLRALHYAPGRAGDLGAVIAPPYDVIGPEDRAALLRRSSRNVVAIDLPEDPAGGDPYAAAAATLAAWRDEGVLVRDAEPAVWVLEQDYTGPDGRARRRRGFLARIRVEPYGAGRVRPHERTHPGPREDRLRLTRATRANVSPIFALHDDPDRAAWAALAPHASGAPWGEARDADEAVHRVWRVADPGAIAAVRDALAPSELLIADGHHRYETARVYADELGGEGPHRYVLACLVALQDPGLTVFPTHRLATGVDAGASDRLDAALERDWVAEPVDPADLEPAPGDGVRIGVYDRHGARRLTLRDPAIAAAALPGRPAPYRRLDTAVLEALVLTGALGLSEDDISHLHGLAYAGTVEEARARVDAGEAQAAFVMGATPVERIRDVAAAGEVMPPKSTYFFPKVPTGIVLNPLDED
jgi:uncharacterized protein (DUF1015 family)